MAEHLDWAGITLIERSGDQTWQPDWPEGHRGAIRIDESAIWQKPSSVRFSAAARDVRATVADSDRSGSMRSWAADSALRRKTPFNSSTSGASHPSTRRAWELSARISTPQSVVERLAGLPVERLTEQVIRRSGEPNSAPIARKSSRSHVRIVTSVPVQPIWMLSAETGAWLKCSKLFGHRRRAVGGRASASSCRRREISRE